MFHVQTGTSDLKGNIHYNKSRNFKCYDVAFKYFMFLVRKNKPVFLDASTNNTCLELAESTKYLEERNTARLLSN